MDKTNPTQLTGDKHFSQIPKWGGQNSKTNLLFNENKFFNTNITDGQKYAQENLVQETDDIHEFANGFSIMSENGSLMPTDPTFTEEPKTMATRGDKIATAHPAYVFTLTPKVKKFVSAEEDLSKIVPYTDYIGMTEWQQKRSFEYNYNPFAYKGLPADGLNSSYVFTGDKGGEFIRRNTFFRFSDLRERLCNDPSDRLKLFAKDWLVALAVMNPTKRAAYKLPAGFLPSDEVLHGIKEYLESVSADPQTKYRSHFPTWNSAGVLQTPIQSATFLATLFARSDVLKDAAASSNVSAFIFGRFCKLVHAATLSPRSDWDVTARYWNVPIPDREIQFYYHLPASLRDRLKLHNNGIKDWMSLIVEGHEGTWTAMNGDKEHPKKFLPKRNVDYIPGQTYSTVDQCHKLGSHPQGLYTVYVSKEDWTAMQAGDIKIRPAVWSLPVGWNPTVKIPRSRDETEELPISQAWVTQSRIEVASIWGRRTGQNQVMDGASAVQIARDIWPVAPNGENERPFEWLHRIAFSFGGTGKDGDPDTAQVADNLVFGTAEANTTMMRYEGCIKRLARREQVVDVHVQTYLLHPEQGWEHYSWMSATLRYIWYPSSVDGKLDKTNFRLVDIPLFGRARPTTFEVKMDEKVDGLLTFGSTVFEALFERNPEDEDKVDEEIPEV
ncbi:hypothetical protein VNI00_006236 [Paramarasmius palmivorus]|uniref:Capsid protein n=1 Tax=Paramarasmius palmivorus TaxID=297713 RepID=A0AAW0D846_9AGAR